MSVGDLGRNTCQKLLGLELLDIQSGSQGRDVYLGVVSS